MANGKLVLDDRLYTEEDDWIKKTNKKTYHIGLTDYAQHELKEIQIIELPKVGEIIMQDQAYGILESTKSNFELKSPISGKVIASNGKNLGDIYDEGETASTDQFIGDLFKINKDPYGTWLIEIEIDDEKQLEKLLSPEEYRKNIGF